MNSEEIHLRDYLRVISKRRNLVLTVFGLIFVAVALYTFARTPLYEGTTQVLIEKARPSGLGSEGSYRLYDPEFYETQFQLIKSRAVALRVVRALELTAADLEADRERGLLASLGDWVRDLKRTVKRVILGEMEEPEAVDAEGEEIALADEISENLTVRPFKNSRIVTISYRSPNPEFAARVANTTARAYIEQTLNMKLDSTRLTLDWMTRKAEEERKKLDKAEKALQAYMVANDIVTLEDRLAVTPQKLNQISSQLVIAEAKRKEQEAIYNQVRRLVDSPEEAETLPAVASDPAMQTLRTEILKAEQHVRELSAKYGPKHPVMKKVVGDLEVLRRKRDQEVQRIVRSLENQYELAVSTEEGLRAQLEKTKAEALNLNQKFIQYGVLKREVETNRQLYDALMMKIKEQSITRETQPVNLWIVQKASVPEGPVLPNKPKNLLLGLIVGLMAGIGLAFFVEYLDNTVKYPDETEKALGLSVLGLVSLWKEKDKVLERVLLDQPRSGCAENYRALRTAVMLSSPEGAPGRILITSPGAAAGKTTTAANLAVTMAQTEKKVLLIDGDMRKPRLHRVFGLSNRYGLSNYLAGGSGEDLLQKGPVDNLAIITSGPVPPNPAELLSSARMSKLLDGLEKNFDVIICDTPPLLTVADPRILSRLFKGTVLVVRARQTTFEMAGKAIKSLADINAPVLGLVINALELKKSDYYYQYYYQSYYGEEPEAQEG
ncbi:capsular exopolysaccharide synthesis family protein [Geothermobacter ehrlichii]|uniref:non-specific protein-tyrosine kinase n=1 Tax=Geothermobacter ehrlichii TaxID=213224 RepID=A0A5D3WHR8_9BACT|nr:polysaccharide biosynthesis tyrosine autokinase [Geothermobacter ehrlichii]TYO98336.1 capsular exopolysaccharide synthesis family protein [Geothermobacter ehrlichii]